MKVLMVLFLVTSLSVYLVFLSFQKSIEWREFKEEHNCVVVGQKEDTYVTTLLPGPNGMLIPMMRAVPGETGWLCNDGVTYWR